MDTEKGDEKGTQMESNKDEAIRAKEIAERKFMARDILGAREFALKAKNLFPDLEGIAQLLATIDVHFTALVKRNGEADWYGILGVTPRADDATVKKQYRKLALMLHPDKNKSIGAEVAFILISKAWDFLSDKAKKVAYDEKINAKAFKQNPRTQDGTAKEHVSASANESKPMRFLTFCHRCQRRYDCLMVYRNHKVPCKHCKAIFLAVQIAPPETDSRPATPWKLLQPQPHSCHRAASWGLSRKKRRFYQQALGKRKCIEEKITAEFAQMESNKYKAIKAKEMAESKFIARDFTGAREFAMKAHHLFPGLGGIPQMLLILHVYVAASTNINGEVNWYRILGVTPQTDDYTVSEQYRKLALMLYPDKNKSIGAQVAFILICKAWDILSDKAKRVAYDEKINVKSYKKHPRTQEGNAQEQVSTSANESKPKTFWTFCHRCQMRYECLMVDLNHKVTCKHCKEIVLAVQIAPPETDISPATSWKLMQNQPSSCHRVASWELLQNKKPFYQQALGKRKCIAEKITAEGSQMESNKDKAIKAKEIAERKFIARDIRGAREFATKAQHLFPDLEGIPQLLLILDVYIAASTKINGEANWYGILGVTPRADDDTVREQYRKLALMLRPDKNKCVGAKVAFLLISEAWNLLSDKAKKVAYDEKINAKAFKQHAKEHVSNSANESKPKTFWTFCHRCRVQYEYFIVYLNRELICEYCKEIFLAVQIAPPKTDIIPWKLVQNQQRFYQIGERRFIAQEITGTPVDPFSRTSSVSSGAQAANVVQHAHLKVMLEHEELGERRFIVQEITATPIDPFSRTSGVSSGAQAANVIQHAHQNVRQEHEEAQAAMKIEEDLSRKLVQDVAKEFFFHPAKRRRGMEDSSLSSHGLSWTCKITKTTTTTTTKVFSYAELQNLSEMETNHTDEVAVKESRNESNDYQKVNVKEEDMVKVNNADAIIKETTDDNIAEDNGEEMVNDIGKLGEDKEGNNKDMQ